MSTHHHMSRRNARLAQSCLLAVGSAGSGTFNTTYSPCWHCSPFSSALCFIHGVQPTLARCVFRYVVSASMFPIRANASLHVMFCMCCYAMYSGHQSAILQYVCACQPGSHIMKIITGSVCSLLLFLLLRVPPAVLASLLFGDGGSAVPFPRRP